jgi:hypothetical protein
MEGRGGGEVQGVAYPQKRYLVLAPVGLEKDRTLPIPAPVPVPAPAPAPVPAFQGRTISARPSRLSAVSLVGLLPVEFLSSIQFCDKKYRNV